MQKVGRNVYVGTDICNHSFVTTTEGVVMIDTPMAPSAAAVWKDEIARHGTLLYLINTEGHMDHFGGNYFFDCTIVAHEGARKGILEAQVDAYAQMIGMAAPGEGVPEGFYLRPPTVTFNDRMTLHVGGNTFHLMSLPGHTPFQAMVYLEEEGVLFAGDNVVCKTMPFFHQAVPLEWLDTLKRLEDLDIQVVVPGHGEICDKGCVAWMTAEVRVWIDAVKAAMEKGMTMEEAQDKVSLLDRYPAPEGRPDMRAMFQRMSVGRLYEMLKRRP
jgi:cyclase